MNKNRSELEGSGTSKGERLARDGMTEGKGLGMEAEPLEGMAAAIEGVADDGTPEAVAVGTVHSQLVGAAGMGGESHTRTAVFRWQNFVVGNFH